MSDKKFTEYVTSSAFRIDLSKKMCEMLLSLYEDTYTPPVEVWKNHFSRSSFEAAMQLRESGAMYQDSYITTGRALERRGLAEHVKGEGYRATNAGMMLVPLLRLAGFESYQQKSKAA